jgi:hypothetical protein
MGDEKRTAKDMRIVRDIANAAENFSRPLTRLNISSFSPPETDARFADFVSHVEGAVTGGRSFLSEQRRHQLSQSFAAGLRVFGFYDYLDIPYVLALSEMENVYNATVVVDVFSPSALRSLLGPWGPHPLDSDTTPLPPPASDRRSWPDFRPVIDRLAGAENAIKRVDREEAARNFTTLFVDTLRGLAGSVRRAWGSSAPSTIHFTVHSGPGNSGYALATFPQHRYTPVSFGGSQLSSPVDDDLPTGHWCFEGALAGSTSAPIRDRWPHFVGPKNTATKTSAF